MRDRFSRRSVVVLWSVVVWCALWSDLSVANVLWGALIGLVSFRLLPVEPSAARQVGFRPVAFAVYLTYAAWALVKSSAVVAWEVVTPRNRINQGIVAVPLRIESVGVATLVANTVSLTPGTLTLEIGHDPLTLYVHIMHLRSLEHVRQDIGVLEGLAMRAFPALPPSPAATAPVTEDAP